ncbi:MAG: type VI secretion system baseplate subunit TssG [Flavobacteriales bacterium]|nr:type VI secretion system baseplate subunit TssG [Flavobacteriales bacterium]
MNLKEKYDDNADVRAEVIAADLLDDGVLLNNITVRPAGTFRRTYSKDVLSAEKVPDETGTSFKLEMEVSREGIYDMLPEGLFHQPDANKRATNVGDVVTHIRKTRKEEEDSRKFFLAIEKELYRLRILVELEERKTLEDYSDHFRNELFFQVWPDLYILKKEYVNPLIQVLPHAFKICGNIQLTEYCFSKVLGYDVSIRITEVMKRNVENTNTTRLGNSRLGIDAFAGDVLIDFFPETVISIGPLGKKQVPDFSTGGSAWLAYQVLCNYLLPADAEPEMKLRIQRGEEHLVLTTEKFDGILNHTSCI